MTVHVTNPEAAAEVEEKAALLARATVAYIARLKGIADIGTLTSGTHGFDYAVTVPQDEKLTLLPVLSDLTMSIEDEFGVKITTLAVAGKPRASRLGDAAPRSETFGKRRHRRGLPTTNALAIEPKPARARKTKTT
ncbi:MAG TPA: hypothetical protein VGC72_13980 [Candidatus Elarobacter sp.]|jgi:hypothetical protein